MDIRGVFVPLDGLTRAEAAPKVAGGLAGPPPTGRILGWTAKALEDPPNTVATQRDVAREAVQDPGAGPEPGTSARRYNGAAGMGAGMPRRSNAEWIATLGGAGADQAAALADLRTYLLRGALFTLQRARHHVGHLGPGELSQLAEDCTQEAITAILQRLADFRGESRFTTWAYTFAVNIALVAARRERWARVPLDRVLDGSESPASTVDDEAASPDPERRALQAEVIAAIRDGIEQHLTGKQQQALRAVVFEQIPLDELVRHWGSNRNALYKLLHDARRKLKSHLLARGFDVKGMLDLFAAGG
jgi:RNA polymerase sigma-70 factor (ECF subfamily)